jgi:3-deoxy-D-manno-octulosonate 8-phosphate phosphatase (KDO 8-P phosphatase)
LLALDSDGVLTDGGVYVAEDGHEFRRFDIKDGLGLKRVMQAGLQVAIISSASCEAVRLRASGLGIESVYLGVEDKLLCLQQICRQLEIGLDEVAYMGDDLPDLPVLSAVGYPTAPANAIDEVKTVSKFISSKPGGAGAVREICDRLVFSRIKVS